jgi:hypothetical protein
MRLFKGCLRADEIAMTRRGANQKDGKGLTGALVQKSRSTAPDPQTPPENPEMDTAELAKAQAAAVTTILTMDDVQKSHYLGLAPDAQVAFLAKSADDRKIEADAAKSAKDKATAEADAAKAGKTATEVETQKALEDTRKELEAIKSERAAEKLDAEISKRARDEFAGYPGGEAKVVELLKAYSGLPEAARKASEDVMKAQCELAKRATGHFGLSEDEVMKGAPAHAELEKKAKDLMAADDTIASLEIAKGRVLSDPRNAELFASVAQEENSQRAAMN